MALGHGFLQKQRTCSLQGNHAIKGEGREGRCHPVLQADGCIGCRAPDTGAAASEHQGKQITLAAHGEEKAVAGCVLSRGNPNEMDM